MLVKDYDLNFTFEMPDEFTEISKSKYDVFGVDEASTLHYFLYLDEDNNEYPFSIYKGEKCDSIEEYEKVVLDEVEKFKEEFPDATVQDVYSITAPNGRRVERLAIDFNDGGYLLVVYYTLVNGYIVTASANILEDADEYEAGLMDIMLSIKETE